MEKLSRVSSGFFTGTTQGAIKKVVSDDSNQIEAFLAHHLCEIAAAVATPVFTLLYLFGMDWRLAIVTLLPILISLVLLSACLKQPNKAALQVELHDAPGADAGDGGGVYPWHERHQGVQPNPQRLSAV